MATDPSEQPEVLLVEDNPGDARLIEHNLRVDSSGVFETPAITHVESLDAATEKLEDGQYDLVLLDLGLPESSGLETLERLQRHMDDTGVSLPVIVLTGLDDQEAALEAIRAGAQDYLVKRNFEGDALERSIRHALERYRQAQELKRQNDRLERFASVVSHDLRNPLNVAQVTVEGLAADADEREAEFERVRRAHDRMESIVEDVLTLARQGQSVDETETVSLADLAASCRDTVDAPGLTLDVEFEGTIRADPGRLRQLLENLFRNSAEHGGEDVTVTIGELDGGFFVADDGPGIPEEDRDEVFEAGFTTTDDGTGFGLNIVKDIAEAHGWRVALTDSESGGARFEFTGVSPGDR